MKRVHVASIALGIIAGASWAIAPTLHPRLESSIDPGVARELAAADLVSHWAALDARSAALASLPLFAAAVATDAATVRDLSADEQAFRVTPPESVELGQVHGNRVISLWRAPESAPPVPLDRLGHWLSVTDRELRFTAIASIVPAQGAEEMRGAVAVSTVVAADAAVRRLAARAPGRLVVGGVAVEIAGGIPEGAATIEVSLDGVPGAPRLILPVATSTPPLAHALRGIGAASLLGGLVMAAVIGARRRRQQQRGQKRTTMTGVGAQPAPERTSGSRSAPPSGSRSAQTERTSAGRSAQPSGIAAIATSPGVGVHFELPALPRLGGYQALALLGEGGTASVFLARLAGDSRNRLVALKVLRPELAQQERAHEMFLDEARITASVDHPNVVRIFDLGHTDGQPFIAMEHVDGSDLESLLHDLRAEGRLVPLDIAAAILQRLCAGLHAAHLAVDPEGRPLYIVHRDVKPGNVLVSRDGGVKVGDFGVAKARRQIHTSLLGEARGTAAFMAPEQRLGQIVDPRTDVFGIAAIGFELVSGVEIDLDLARLRQYGTRRWPHLPPIHEVRPEVPPALEQLLFRALSYAPDDRHPTCADLAADLAAVADDAGWAVGDQELASWVRGELARRSTFAGHATASASVSASGQPGVA